MRIANLDGRAVLLGAERALDVERASSGRFGADPQAVWPVWSELLAWGTDIDVDAHPDADAFTTADLLAPVPRPSQVFAIGLNYADHAAEARMQLPENPLVFTKFQSSIVGPDVDVRLTSDHVDWEVELVAVIGAGGRDIPLDRAWDAIAGFTVGQDLSDRIVQNWGRPAQFSLGKSMAGFGPTGPAVVSLDEVRAANDPSNLRLTTSVIEDGVTTVLQDGTSSDMIFSIPDLVSRLSAIVELLPGDLVFTGTPSGVGMGREPQRFLKSGQTLVSEIEGLGTITQRLV